MKFFADTSFFAAYYDQSDQYNLQAEKLVKKFFQRHPQIITSDYIYTETLTLLLKSHPFYGYHRSKLFDHHVIESNTFDMIFISDYLFKKAREIFFSFNKDKVWSFTDCTSFALMEDYGLKDALTFDKNFSQRGFKIVG